MDGLDLTEFEQRILDLSTHRRATVRRMVLMGVSHLLALIILYWLLRQDPSSGDLGRMLGLLIILMAWVRLRYERSILGYQSVVHKLASRMGRTGRGEGDKVPDPA